MILSVEAVEKFLNIVDCQFPVPLSQKQNLSDFSEKLVDKATLCAETYNGEIVALTAGYTDNLIDNVAYISIVAVLPQYRGKGLASKTVTDFLNICSQKNINAVHLYAVPDNIPAIKMYEKLGFVPWVIPNEPRPDDAHLIFYIKDEFSE